MTKNLDAWPTELRLRDGGRTLRVTFEDGRSFDLSAEYLRVESPSAEVQGHAPNQKQTVAGKQDVAVTEVVPTGNYAVRLVFSDGHSTGIFTWGHLASLGAEHAERWQAYLDALGAKGLSRIGAR